jgi:hypothetical protein
MGTILEAPPLPASHHKCVDSCSHERTTSEKREENSSPTRFLLLSSPLPAPAMASRLSAIAWLAGSWTVASAAGLPCLSWVSCWYGAFLDPPLLCPLLVVSAFIANWSGYLYLFFVSFGLGRSEICLFPCGRQSNNKAPVLTQYCFSVLCLYRKSASDMRIKICVSRKHRDLDAYLYL